MGDGYLAHLQQRVGRCAGRRSLRHFASGRQIEAGTLDTSPWRFQAMRDRTSVRAVGVSAAGALLLLMAVLPGRIYADGNVQPRSDPLTTKHRVADIVNHPAFKGFGELVLPW